MRWAWCFGVSASLAGGLILRLARGLSASLRTIRKLTSEDALTGLPNHRVMLETPHERAGSAVPPASWRWCLIDLDGFREVNDTHGRSGGDALMNMSPPVSRRAFRMARNSAGLTTMSSP